MTSTDRTGGRWSEVERDREHELLARMHALPDGDPGREAARAELITLHLPLVQHLARRYRDRGEPYEDLVQVGTVGLIKAIDGFDPQRGLELSTYATPTILGEIKRHFRDRTWAVRVPRRLQELQAQVARTADELSVTLQRSPTVREIATALEVSEADVLDALEARQAYTARSIEASAESEGPASFLSSFGALDSRFEEFDDREALRPLIEALPERERAIVLMRFVENMSQSQIGDELGISQMHVSRLLSRTLVQLREGLAEKPTDVSR